MLPTYYDNALYGQNIANVRRSCRHPDPRSHSIMSLQSPLSGPVLSAFVFGELPRLKSMGGHFSLLPLHWGCLIFLRITLRNLAGRARNDVLSYEMVSAFSHFLTYIPAPRMHWVYRCRGILCP